MTKKEALALAKTIDESSAFRTDEINQVGDFFCVLFHDVISGRTYTAFDRPGYLEILERSMTEEDRLGSLRTHLETALTNPNRAYWQSSQDTPRIRKVLTELNQMQERQHITDPEIIALLERNGLGWARVTPLWKIKERQRKIPYRLKNALKSLSKIAEEEDYMMAITAGLFGLFLVAVLAGVVILTKPAVITKMPTKYIAARVADMQNGDRVYVHSSSLHLDATGETWIDPSAPVKTEEPKEDQYLALQKDSLGTYHVILPEDLKETWTKEKDKDFKVLGYFPVRLLL